MNYLLISACLLLSPICLAQQVEMATAISPEDLGAYKWNFSGTANEKSVVIFRVTTVREWPNGKVTTQIHDLVHYSPGKKQTASAFFIDPHYFEPKEKEPKWRFSVLGGSGWIEGRYAGHSYGNNKGEINFKSEKWGKTKKVFETFIKSYDNAALLYNDLPPIPPNGGWSWAGSPKEQSKQDSADQPATGPESKAEGEEKTEPESKRRPNRERKAPDVTPKTK